METIKKGQKHIRRAALAICNVILMLLAVLFTVWYSSSVRSSQNLMMRESFCNMVETMKQISERYLSDELDKAANWGVYIEQQHMTMDEAMDYIRTVSTQSECEAHFVDMDTFEAWSTRTSKNGNTVSIYSHYYDSGAEDERYSEYISRMRKMFAGEKCVLGKYNIKESQISVISVGMGVTLRQSDGTDRDYLMLRVVPVDSMKKLWLFPVDYSSAEIGLISTNGDYVIPSRSMRSENFAEFVRYYSFPDDFSGVDSQLRQLEEQTSGLMELNNSRSQPSYWYYSRLDEFEGLDILGYIPVADLTTKTDNISVVIAVAGALLLIALIDGSYIMSINRRLRSAVDIAEKASRAKTQFLSSMSHDIRTPLNAVIGMTELAQGHMDDTAYVQECLRKISISGNHLLTLINDILEISRVESGRINLNLAAFDVRELISSIESITRSQAAGHGLKFEVSFGEIPEPYLLGDKLRLTQVYLNLLNNAVKYTNPGGTVHLGVGEEKQSDGCIILACRIEDNGVGMSEEFQKNMYDAFTRVADSRIDKIQGSGLGLAIVKRMVDLMNGTIECRSAENVGTVFDVRIPLTPAEKSELTNAAAEDESEFGRDLAGVSILVAEDNELNWEIISEMLNGYGINCERAENGRVCVDMLLDSPPGEYDLVFMDVQMPVMNGRDAARALRRCSRDDLRRLPIVAMTADAFAEDVQLCLDAGMDAHISKPVEIDKVLSEIRLMLRQKRGNDNNAEKEKEDDEDEKNG